jgi:hypothetical protein
MTPAAGWAGRGGPQDAGPTRLEIVAGRRSRGRLERQRPRLLWSEVRSWCEYRMKQRYLKRYPYANPARSTAFAGDVVPCTVPNRTIPRKNKGGSHFLVTPALLNMDGS